MSVCVFVSIELLCSDETHFRGVLPWVSTHVCRPDLILVKNGQKMDDLLTTLSTFLVLLRFSRD
jgi:hypothetical protein